MNERVNVSTCKMNKATLSWLRLVCCRHEVPVTSEPITVIHMDEDVVVVNKPASIPVSGVLPELYCQIKNNNNNKTDKVRKLSVSLCFSPTCPRNDDDCPLGRGVRFPAAQADYFWPEASELARSIRPNLAFVCCTRSRGYGCLDYSLR